MEAPRNGGELVYLGTREGTVRVLDRQGLSPTPLLDLTGQIDEASDNGLQSITFDPAFAQNRWMYLYYNPVGTQDAIIQRYTLAPDGRSVVPASAHTVWRYTRDGSGHNGGWMAFGPDGNLYLSLGDCGTFVAPDPPNRAQSLASFCGKIVRIDLSSDAFPTDANRNFAIPPSNPYVGVAGAQDLIWSSGLRNPWRCDFDRATGDLWIADVGHELWEEINVVPAGAAGGRNFGWRCREGPNCSGFGGCDCASPALTNPDWSYDHSFGCSIIGGPVYRGSAIPSLTGRYFFTDWCVPNVWSVRRSAGVVGDLRDHTTDLFPAGADLPVGVATFGTDAHGEMYICDTGGGTIWKVVPYRCNAADIASLGGAPGADARLTVDDLILFLSSFFAQDRELADVATVGGAMVPDTQLTADDLIVYLREFFRGCP